MGAATKAMPPSAIEDGEWITVKRASELLNISRHRVMTCAARGQLKTEFVANRLVVSRASVEAFGKGSR